MQTQRRTTAAVLLVLTIFAGLLVRMAPLHLPYVVWKYAGSALWAAAVYWLLALLLPAQPTWRVAVLAAMVALAVEFSRLHPQPAIDRFRLTLAGRLLLGRIFGWWNIVAYGLGITLAGLLDARLRSRRA